jgi:hypothetical protein
LKIRETCKRRYLGRTETPLLVPSFSSTVTPRIGDIFAKVKEQLTTASLVSAYDLNFKHINKDDIWYSKNVFVDSGTYEKRKLNNKESKKWSVKMYGNLLDQLQPLTNLIIVNYDEVGNFDSQLSAADDFFKGHPIGKKEFLFKRSAELNRTINVRSLTDNIQRLKGFDVIGITKDEMGNSLLERCETIVKVRRSLDSAGLQTPIHVFGCLDPLSILAYFFCGADIFDGLVWLRHGFQDNVAMYQSNFALVNKKWAEYDDSLSLFMYVSNLSSLNRLMVMMNRITQNWELERLRALLTLGQFGELKDLLDQADIDMEAA